MLRSVAATSGITGMMRIGCPRPTMSPEVRQTTTMGGRSGANGHCADRGRNRGPSPNPPDPSTDAFAAADGAVSGPNPAVSYTCYSPFPPLAHTIVSGDTSGAAGCRAMVEAW